MILNTLCMCLLLGRLCSGDLTFPSGFKFGVASSAYQIEGAWNVSGKGESIWDHASHSTNLIVKDGSNGDVACDSYHRYKEDVQLIKKMGLDFYRFSISWTRILPSGFPNQTNKAGKQYYSQLIDELLSQNIEPVVTMFQNDLPQKLQDLGGWTNPLIVEWFGDYAEILYSLYGNRVKTWLTINEPVIMCDLAYNTGLPAPGIIDADRGSYICSKNVLLAHAKAWRIYDEKYRHLYGGKVSLVNNLEWNEGLTEEDQQLAELVNEYSIGRYSHPIYSEEGDWPSCIKKIIAENSENEGYPRSRLPDFTAEEIKFVRGTFDFYAINHYTSHMITKAKPGDVLGPFPTEDVPELRAKQSSGNWTKDAMSIAVNPKGVRSVLNWLKNKYGDISVLITENGFATSGSAIEDNERIQCIHDYLEQILLAIKEDGVDVFGYSVWSLMDDFEWHNGYKYGFGLHHVNFSDPELVRIPRKSARYYGDVIKARSLLDVPN